MTAQPFDKFATNAFFKFLAPVVAAVMEHPLRRRFNDPAEILKAAGLQPGQHALEVGCGTGFFTIPAAGLVGDTGLVHSIDLYPRAVEHVTQKVQEAGLTNVKLTLADALATGLPDSGFDLILLLGVIPSPTLPLERLLPEMHRLLKTNGELVVWTIFSWGLCTFVNRSGLFVHIGKESGGASFQKTGHSRQVKPYGYHSHPFDHSQRVHPDLARPAHAGDHVHHAHHAAVPAGLCGDE